MDYKTTTALTLATAFLVAPASGQDSEAPSAVTPVPSLTSIRLETIRSRDEALLRDLASALSERYGHLLEGTKVLFTRIETYGTIFFRLDIEDIENEESARALCQILEMDRCLVARPGSSPLVSGEAFVIAADGLVDMRAVGEVSGDLVSGSVEFSPLPTVTPTWAPVLEDKLGVLPVDRPERGNAAQPDMAAMRMSFLPAREEDSLDRALAHARSVNQDAPRLDLQPPVAPPLAVAPASPPFVSLAVQDETGVMVPVSQPVREASRVAALISDVQTVRLAPRLRPTFGAGGVVVGEVVDDSVAVKSGPRPLPRPSRAIAVVAEPVVASPTSPRPLMRPSRLAPQAEPSLDIQNDDARQEEQSARPAPVWKAGPRKALVSARSQEARVLAPLALSPAAPVLAVRAVAPAVAPAVVSASLLHEQASVGATKGARDATRAVVSQWARHEIDMFLTTSADRVVARSSASNREQGTELRVQFSGPAPMLRPDVFAQETSFAALMTPASVQSVALLSQERAASFVGAVEDRVSATLVQSAAPFALGEELAPSARDVAVAVPSRVDADRVLARVDQDPVSRMAHTLDVAVPAAGETPVLPRLLLTKSWPSTDVAQTDVTTERAALPLAPREHHRVSALVAWAPAVEKSVQGVTDGQSLVAQTTDVLRAPPLFAFADPLSAKWAVEKARLVQERVVASVGSPVATWGVVADLYAAKGEAQGRVPSTMSDVVVAFKSDLAARVSPAIGRELAQLDAVQERLASSLATENSSDVQDYQDVAMGNGAPTAPVAFERGETQPSFVETASAVLGDLPVSGPVDSAGHVSAPRAFSPENDRVAAVKDALANDLVRAQAPLVPAQGVLLVQASVDAARRTFGESLAPQSSEPARVAKGETTFGSSESVRVAKASVEAEGRFVQAEAALVPARGVSLAQTPVDGVLRDAQGEAVRYEAMDTLARAAQPVAAEKLAFLVEEESVAPAQDSKRAPAARGGLLVRDVSNAALILASSSETADVASATRVSRATDNYEGSRAFAARAPQASLESAPQGRSADGVRSAALDRVTARATVFGQTRLAKGMEIAGVELQNGGIERTEPRDVILERVGSAQDIAERMVSADALQVASVTPARAEIRARVELARAARVSQEVRVSQSTTTERAKEAPLLLTKPWSATAPKAPKASLDAPSLANAGVFDSVADAAESSKIVLASAPASVERAVPGWMNALVVSDAQEWSGTERLMAAAIEKTVAKNTKNIKDLVSVRSISSLSVIDGRAARGQRVAPVGLVDTRTMPIEFLLAALVAPVSLQSPSLQGQSPHADRVASVRQHVAPIVAGVDAELERSNVNVRLISSDADNNLGHAGSALPYEGIEVAALGLSKVVSQERILRQAKETGRAARAQTERPIDEFLSVWDEPMPLATSQLALATAMPRQWGPVQAVLRSSDIVEPEPVLWTAAPPAITPFKAIGRTLDQVPTLEIFTQVLAGPDAIFEVPEVPSFSKKAPQRVAANALDDILNVQREDGTRMALPMLRDQAREESLPDVIVATVEAEEIVVESKELRVRVPRVARPSSRFAVVFNDMYAVPFDLSGSGRPPLQRVPSLRPSVGVVGEDPIPEPRARLIAADTNMARFFPSPVAPSGDAGSMVERLRDGLDDTLDALDVTTDLSAPVVAPLEEAPLASRPPLALPPLDAALRPLAQAPIVDDAALADAALAATILELDDPIMETAVPVVPLPPVAANPAPAQPDVFGPALEEFLATRPQEQGTDPAVSDPLDPVPYAQPSPNWPAADAMGRNSILDMDTRRVAAPQPNDGLMIRLSYATSREEVTSRVRDLMRNFPQSMLEKGRFYGSAAPASPGLFIVGIQAHNALDHQDLMSYMTNNGIPFVMPGQSAAPLLTDPLVAQ